MVITSLYIQNGGEVELRGSGKTHKKLKILLYCGAHRMRHTASTAHVNQQ
jgi:hypothetical protein